MKAECIISVGVFVVIIFVVLVSCCKKKQTVGLDDKHDKERDQFITRNKKTKSITTKGTEDLHDYVSTSKGIKDESYSTDSKTNDVK